MAGPHVLTHPFAVRVDPKALEPRGAITPGVPELKAQVRQLRRAEGHRGMGIRKPSVKPKGGVSGDGGSRSSP